MRIAFFGDSLTWGGYGGNFVDEVAALMPAHDIINAGIGGNTVVNMLNRLDKVLGLEPDGIFVMVGGNDAIAHSQPAVRGYYRMTRGAPDGYMSLELFRRSYRELLTQIQLAQVLTWVGLETTEHSQELFDVMQTFNAVARDTARSLNIPILDLGEHFRAVHLREQAPLTEEDIALIGKRARSGWSDYETERQRGHFTFTFDGMHFTPESAQRAGLIIAEFLGDYV